MRSDRHAQDQKREEAYAMLIGALIAAALALLYPQSFGLLLGGAVGAAHPWRFEDRADRRYWRSLAGWSIAAGLCVAGIYALLVTTLDAEIELRHFHRQWGWGHFSPAAFVDHPWAWLPLTSATALIGTGAAILWRAR